MERRDSFQEKENYGEGSFLGDSYIKSYQHFRQYCSHEDNVNGNMKQKEDAMTTHTVWKFQVSLPHFVNYNKIHTEKKKQQNPAFESQ